MSRILSLSLIATGAVTALVFLIPDLIILAGIALIIPGLILALVPSLFLYNLTFSLPWFSLRSKGQTLASIAGVGAIALVAVIVPDGLNRQTNHWLQDAASKELKPAKPIESPAVISLEQPAHLWSQDSCNDLCQLLLLNGVAQKVIAIPPADAPHSQRTAPPAPIVFRLERQSDCAVNPATQAALKRTENRWTQSAAAIAKAMHFRVATGECLIAEPLAGPTPSLTLRAVEESIGHAPSHLSLLPGNVKIHGIEIRNGVTILARESARSATPLQLPLHLEPYGGGELHLRGWQWARSASREEQFKPVEMLKNLTAFDLSTPRGATPEEIRRYLDDALNHPQAPSGPFLLAADYYELLGPTPPDESDFRRLARMIGDDRMTNFSYFHQNCSDPKHLSESMRDPILRRLSLLADIHPPADYRALVRIAACLPPAAYRGSVSQLDELLADPAIRRNSLELIPRLADQGPAGAAKLAMIVLSSWQKDSRGSPIRWERDAEPALQGLCRLGPQASAILPQLRLFQSQFPGNTIFNATFWPVTLVSLGADPAEFPVPSYQKVPARYYDDLRRQAQRCSQPR